MKVAFRDYNGKYGSTWDGPNLKFDRDAIGPGETFEMIELDKPPDPAVVPPSFSEVTVYGSDAVVFTFPESAAMTSIEFRATEMELHTTGTEDWPLVPLEPNAEPAQAATLWIFLFIDGVWYATGAERLRKEQLNGTKPEGHPSTLVGVDWLYDESRWGPMAGYNPAPGEWVGLMVVAGSTRSDYNVPLEARTQVVMYQWPSVA